MLLDRTNLHLMELLQRDARVDTSELARLVNRTESTVRERLANLEREGVVRGYGAVIDPARLGFPIHAHVRAESGLRGLHQLRDQLSALPLVTGAALTTGSKPLRLELRAESPEHLERFLENRLAPLGLQRLETGLVIDDLVPPRPLPLGLAAAGLLLRVDRGPSEDQGPPKARSPREEEPWPPAPARV